MEFGPKLHERRVFFESACKDAEVAYAKNPLDAKNLSQWGNALLELSQFQNPADAGQFVEDATSKLEEALQITPRKHNTLWCLGNAHTSRALLLTDIDSAKIYFEKATQCFKQALEEDPGNSEYASSVEFSFKARELHAEIQRQIQPDAIGLSSTSNTKTPKLHTEIQRQIQPDAGGRSLISNSKVPKKKKTSDLKYDILGWVILAVGIVTCVGMAKHHILTAPSPPSSQKDRAYISISHG